MRLLALALLLLSTPAGAQVNGDPTTASADQEPVVLIPELATLHVVYPDAERPSGRGDTVLVLFVVEEDGQISGASIVHGVSPGLDSAAVEAVRAFPFAPLRQEGRPVRSRFAVPVEFRLVEGREVRYVTTDLALREAPRVRAAVVGRVPRGTQVTATDCRDGWCHVTFSDISGYAMEASLSE